MKRLLFLSVVLASMVICGVAFALSDAEYKKFKSASPAFTQAEKSLAETWKAIKSANGGQIPSVLMTEQKRWVQVERDSEAKALFNKMSPADAYAEVTNKRVQMLKTMWLREQPAQAAPVQSAQGQGSAADITGEYPGWYDNKYAENANVAIKKSGEDEYEVEVTRVGNPDSGVNSWCNFQGKGRLQKNILQATGISEADGKRYILSIHFRNNNIIEILDENGDLRANFCGGPGFLDGKYKKK